MTTYGFDDSKNRREVYTKEEAVSRNDIIVIYGQIKMPEANAESLTGMIEINYPNGFTKDNSIVVSIMSTNGSDEVKKDYWSTPMTSTLASSKMFGNGDVVATLKPENIQVRSNKTASEAPSWLVKFKLVLMKYEVLDSEYTLGDVNQDGSITDDDITILNKYRLNTIALTEQQVKAADVNKDGVVDDADILKINKYINGMIDSLE